MGQGRARLARGGTWSAGGGACPAEAHTVHGVDRGARSSNGKEDAKEKEQTVFSV